MTFTDALRAHFGDRPFLLGEVTDSDIPFSLFPDTVRTAGLRGHDVTLSLGHVFASVPGVTLLGRTRYGNLWTVES